MDWRGPIGLAGIIILAGLALCFGGSTVGIASTVFGSGGANGNPGSGLIGLTQALTLSGMPGNTPPGVRTVGQ